jgi:hypothetical protein
MRQAQLPTQMQNNKAYGAVVDCAGVVRTTRAHGPVQSPFCPGLCALRVRRGGGGKVRALSSAACRMKEPCVRAADLPLALGVGFRAGDSISRSCRGTRRDSVNGVTLFLLLSLFDLGTRPGNPLQSEVRVCDVALDGQNDVRTGARVHQARFLKRF